MAIFWPHLAFVFVLFTSTARAPIVLNSTSSPATSSAASTRNENQDLKTSLSAKKTNYNVGLHTRIKRIGAPPIFAAFFAPPAAAPAAQAAPQAAQAAPQAAQAAPQAGQAAPQAAQAAPQAAQAAPQAAQAAPQAASPQAAPFRALFAQAMPNAGPMMPMMPMPPPMPTPMPMPTPAPPGQPSSGFGPGGTFNGIPPAAGSAASSAAAAAAAAAAGLVPPPPVLPPIPPVPPFIPPVPPPVAPPVPPPIPPQPVPPPVFPPQPPIPPSFPQPPVPPSFPQPPFSPSIPQPPIPPSAPQPPISPSAPQPFSPTLANANIGPPQPAGNAALGSGNFGQSAGGTSGIGGGGSSSSGSAQSRGSSGGAQNGAINNGGGAATLSGGVATPAGSAGNNQNGAPAISPAAAAAAAAAAGGGSSSLANLPSSASSAGILTSFDAAEAGIQPMCGGLGNSFRSNRASFCCNSDLQRSIQSSMDALRSSRPDWTDCNIQQIARRVQKDAEAKFNMPFEVVASNGEYASKSQYTQNAVCKVETNGIYILAYSLPTDEAKRQLPSCKSGLNRYRTKLDRFCCSNALGSLLEGVIGRLRAKRPGFSECNSDQIARQAQHDAEAKFGRRFEVIAGVGQIVSSSQYHKFVSSERKCLHTRAVHFSDNICQIEMNGAPLLAYGLPNDDERVDDEKTTTPDAPVVPLADGFAADETPFDTSLVSLKS